MSLKKFLFATAFISIATAISIAGYLYFAKQQPALAQTANIYYVDPISLGCSVPVDVTYNATTRLCGTGSAIVYNTIQGAINGIALVPGDILDVRGGIYHEIVNIGIGDEGSASGQVTLRAHTMETVTIDADGAAIAVALSSNVDYITLDGFTVVDFGGQIGNQIQAGVKVTTIHQGVVVKNMNITIQNYGTTLMGDNVTQSDINMSNCTDCQILSNILSTTDSSNGAQTEILKLGWNTNLIIDGNTITHYNSYDGAINHSDTIQLMTSINTTIRNNFIYNKYDPGAQGIFAGILSGETAQDYGWIKIYNNVIVGALANAGIIIFNKTAGSTYTFYIWNNYIRNEASMNAIRITETGVTGGILTNSSEIKNNILVTVLANKTITYIEESDVSPIVDNNILYNEGGTFRSVYQGVAKTTIFDWNTIISGADIYISPNIDFNYKPLFGSIAIDTGLNLNSNFTTDKSNAPRPQGSAWDIGAYEYIQASPPLKGDFNSDSKVNNLDFTVFKNAFKSIFNSIFDLNSDSAIDVKDLGVLMSGWLE